MKARTRHYVVQVALSVALLIAIWCVDYLPTNDGPNHILLGYLVGHLDDPGKGYAHFVKPAWPVTTLAFHTLFAAFERLMPWKEALRATFTVGALLWAWGFGFLVTTLNRRRRWLTPIGFATALPWCFYMGMFSFWLSCGVGLWLLGYALQRSRWRWTQWLVLSAMLLVMAISHVFAAALMGVILTVLVAYRSQPGGRVRDVGSLVVIGLPALVVAVISSGVITGSSVVDPGPPGTIASGWGEIGVHLRTLSVRFTGGPPWRGGVPAVLAVVGLVWLARRLRRRQATRDELALGTASVLLLLAGGLSPLHLELWHYFAPRFLAFGFLLGVVLVPFEQIRHGLSRMLAADGVAALALVSIGWSAQHHRALAAETADALAAASAPLHRSGPRLPLILKPPVSVGHGRPHANVGHLFTLQQGGMTPHMFASDASLDAYVYRKPGTELFPGGWPMRFVAEAYRLAGSSPEYPPREEQLALAAVVGAPYEDVIVWSDPEDLDAFVERGYVTDVRRGRVAIMHFVPCGLDVEIETPRVTADPLLVQYGWAPLEDKAEMAVSPAGARYRSGRAKLRFPWAPCGPIWVRVVWDQDRSGKAGPRDLFCEGADEQGRVQVTLRRGAADFRCRPAGTVRGG